MSITGMKFLCAVSVRKDYVVKLSIQLDKTSQVGVVGVVTWVETPKPRHYLVGIRFHAMSEASRAKLLKFLHSTAPGT